jgi:hypothetical protein
MRGHSRSKNGVASLAYDPRIHPVSKKMDCRVKPGNDVCGYGFKITLPITLRAAMSFSACAVSASG